MPNEVEWIWHVALSPWPSDDVEKKMLQPRHLHLSNMLCVVYYLDSNLLNAAVKAHEYTEAHKRPIIPVISVCFSGRHALSAALLLVSL